MNPVLFKLRDVDGNLELDCGRKDTQFQSVDGGRWLRVGSREVARAVIEELGKEERRCGHCSLDTQPT